MTGVKMSDILRINIRIEIGILNRNLYRSGETRVRGRYPRVGLSLRTWPRDGPVVDNPIERGAAASSATPFYLPYIYRHDFFSSVDAFRFGEDKTVYVKIRPEAVKKG